MFPDNRDGGGVCETWVLIPDVLNLHTHVNSLLCCVSGLCCCSDGRHYRYIRDLMSPKLHIRTQGIVSGMETRLSTNSYRKLKACSRHISQPKNSVCNQTSSAYNHLRNRNNSGKLLVLTFPHSIVGLSNGVRSAPWSCVSSLC
jgi:hypothetical protein